MKKMKYFGKCSQDELCIYYFKCILITSLNMLYEYSREDLKPCTLVPS